MDDAAVIARRLGRRRAAGALTAIVSAIGLAACGGSAPFPDQPPPPSPVQRGQLDVGGLVCTYRLYSPISLDRTRPAPLVLVLGGVGNDGESMATVTDFDGVAEEERFVVAYPDGINDTWNAGYCCLGRATAGPDDVAFLTALIDQVSAEVGIDAARVYATGVSAGAMMAYRLGCEVSERITAVGSVAGAMVLEACQPSEPVSVIEIHGTVDGLVPYEGGRTAGGATQPSPATPAVAQRWAGLNRCATPPAEVVEGPLTTASWTGCAEGSAVKLITVNGGGHTWFASGLGPADGAVDASRAIWAFFASVPPGG